MVHRGTYQDPMRFTRDGWASTQPARAPGASILEKDPLLMTTGFPLDSRSYATSRFGV